MQDGLLGFLKQVGPFVRFLTFMKSLIAISLGFSLKSPKTINLSYFDYCVLWIKILSYDF